METRFSMSAAEVMMIIDRHLRSQHPTATNDAHDQPRVVSIEFSPAVKDGHPVTLVYKDQPPRD